MEHNTVCKDYDIKEKDKCIPISEGNCGSNADCTVGEYCKIRFGTHNTACNYFDLIGHCTPIDKESIGSFIYDNQEYVYSKQSVGSWFGAQNFCNAVSKMGEHPTIQGVLVNKEDLGCYKDSKFSMLSPDFEKCCEIGATETCVPVVEALRTVQIGRYWTGSLKKNCNYVDKYDAYQLALDLRMINTALLAQSGLFALCK